MIGIKGWVGVLVVALSLGLASCGAGDILDPIDADNPQLYAGTDFVSITKYNDEGDVVQELEFFLARDAESKNVKIWHDGELLVELQGSNLVASKSHAVRAALAEALGQNLENAAPEVVDSIISAVMQKL